jgi:hypothetical protein
MQLLGTKIKQSVFITSNGTLTYGAHLKGVLGEQGTKSAFASVLGNTIDETESEKVINTYLYIDPATKALKEASKTHKWLTGKMKSVNLDSYPESLQKTIVGSLNEVKGIFKEENSYSPLKEHQETLQEDPVLEKLYPELLEMFEVMITEIDTEKKKFTNVGVDDFIQRYAFNKHIMIMGPRGAGKTYTVSQYCEEQGYNTEFIAGHNGLESIDLLGYYVRNASGALIWMDGPLTSAFRHAQTQKSVLFVDEILRIPVRELNILIGALTPDSTGNFQLRTNRILGEEDGMGVSETLKVPVENLWVVSTTNIGADYDTEDMDLALKDRFRMLDMKLSDTSIRSIIEACNNDKFSNTTIDKMMKIYNTVDGLVKTKELTHTINVRYLCEIIDMCPDNVQLVNYFFDLVPNICSRTTDGDINEVEEKTYKQVIKSILS